jgi:hypothetical protein
MAASSFPGSNWHKQACRSPACNGKELAAIKPTKPPSPEDDFLRKKAQKGPFYPSPLSPSYMVIFT